MILGRGAGVKPNTSQRTDAVGLELGEQRSHEGRGHGVDTAYRVEWANMKRIYKNIPGSLVDMHLKQPLKFPWPELLFGIESE